MKRLPSFIPLGILALQSSASTSFAESIRLGQGQPIEIELAHHVTAAYNEGASDAYFRVKKDVVVDDSVLIPKGAWVRGLIGQTTEGTGFGRGGQLALLARSVQAVDGTFVPLGESFGASGQSRGTAAAENAFAGQILGGVAVGVASAGATRGGAAHFFKGADFTVFVGADREIRSAASRSREDPLVAHGSLIEFTAEAEPSEFRINFSGWKPLESIQVKLAAPAGLSLNPEDWKTFSARRIAGVDLPEPVAPRTVGLSPRRSSSRKRHQKAMQEGRTLWFDAWSLLSYCELGLPCRIEINGELPDGRTLAANTQVVARILRVKR